MMVVSYMLGQIVTPVADLITVVKRARVSQRREVKVSEVSNQRGLLFE